MDEEKKPEANMNEERREDEERGQHAKILQEALPRTGLVFSERGDLSEILCKPKILPVKSATLIRMEQLERKARDNALR